MPNQLGNAIPTLQVWLQKSNVRLSRREPLLVHIDNKLQAYMQAPHRSRLSMMLLSACNSPPGQPRKGSAKASA